MKKVVAIGAVYLWLAGGAVLCYYAGQLTMTGYIKLTGAVLKKLS